MGVAIATAATTNRLLIYPPPVSRKKPVPCVPTVCVGVTADVKSYTGAIAACAKAGDGNMAMEWLKTMQEEGISPEVSSVFFFFFLLCCCFLSLLFFLVYGERTGSAINS